MYFQPSNFYLLIFTLYFFAGKKIVDMSSTWTRHVVKAVSLVNLSEARALKTIQVSPGKYTRDKSSCIIVDMMLM